MDTQTDSVEPVDTAQLIQRCNGKVQLAEKMLEMFREDVVRQFSEIKDSVENADLEALSRAAHAMKGTASMVSANKASRLAADVETAARGSDLVLAQSLLDSLSEQVEQCRVFQLEK